MLCGIAFHEWTGILKMQIECQRKMEARTELLLRGSMRILNEEEVKEGRRCTPR